MRKIYEVDHVRLYKNKIVIVKNSLVSISITVPEQEMRFVKSDVKKLKDMTEKHK